MPALGDMTSDTQNTISGFGNQSGERVVMILHDGTIELDSPGLAGLPVTMRVDDSSMSGSTTFSLDRGLILSSTSTNEQVITMSMPGMRMQMRTEGTTLMELVGPVTEPRN